MHEFSYKTVVERFPERHWDHLYLQYLKACKATAECILWDCSDVIIGQNPAGGNVDSQEELFDFAFDFQAIRNKLSVF